MRVVPVIIGVLASALAASAPVALAGDSPSAGDYAGKFNGGRVEIVVKSPTRGQLSYRITSCRRSAGRIRIHLHDGRFSGARPHGGTKVQGRFNGGTVSGRIIRPTAGNARARGRCKSRSKHFTATLVADQAATVGIDDIGHYTGANEAGRPIGFDVVRSSGGLAIENLAVDVDTECWDDYNRDGVDDTLLAHVAGFGGKLSADGSFDIYYAPDEDTEFEFDGEIIDGRAAVDVIVGGRFDEDGTPDLAGPFECDSWGDTYSAARTR